MPSTTLTIHLNRIEDLFAPPGVDPFQVGYHTLSGIAQVASALQARIPRDGLHVIFVLPSGAPKVDESEVQAAIKRYCDVALTVTQTDYDARRELTHKNLIAGTAILGLSLLIAASLTNSEILSPGLRSLFSNSLSILGTVALWGPTDALLFGLRPLRRTIRIYTAIKYMTLEIQRG